MDDPHLIAGPASSNVEPLLELLGFAEGKRSTLGNIHERKEHGVAFVPLKLGAVPQSSRCFRRSTSVVFVHRRHKQDLENELARLT